MHASCQLLLSNTYRHAKMEEKENILSTLSNGANEFDLTPNSPMTVTVSPLNSTTNNKCILETTKSKPKSDVKGNMIKGRYDIKHNNTCHQNLYMYMQSLERNVNAVAFVQIVQDLNVAHASIAEINLSMVDQDG